MIELVALALLADPTGPHRDLAIQQPSSPQPRIYSAFGTRVAGIGDVDGDGAPELLVADTSERDGRVWLFSVGKRKPLYSVAVATKDLSFTAQLCAVGDVDGDGRPDWIVGGDSSQFFRPRETADTFKQRRLAGSDSAWVYSGADGKLLRTFSDERVGQKLGCCVAGFGDLDGDGRADLLLGSRRVAEDKQGGIASVRSGRDGTVLSSVGRELPAGERAYSVQCVGDVNADGGADIGVVCSWEWDDVPKIRIYSGKSGEVLHAKVVDSGRALCLVGAGDLDHDGHADLVVSLRGVARVLSGRDLKVIRELSSASVEKNPENQPLAAGFGQRVALLRARDPSVEPTIVVSAIDTAVWGGTLYFYSSADGKVTARRTDSDIVRQVSIGSTDAPADIHHLGSSLANLGDVDGDDFDDLACGTNNIEGAEDGCALVFSGRHGEPMLELRRKGDGLVVRDLGDRR